MSYLKPLLLSLLLATLSTSQELDSCLLTPYSGSFTGVTWNANVQPTSAVTSIAPGSVGSFATESVSGKQDGVYFGSGNGNGFFSTVQQTTENGPGDEIELGLRVTTRYPPTNFPTTTNVGSSNTQVNVEIPSSKALKIDWSFRMIGSGGGAPAETIADLIAAGGRFEFGVDIDPTDDVVYSSYDQLSADARVPPGFPIQADHAWLNQAGTQVSGLPPATDYLTQRAASAGAQNSWQPRFSPPGTKLRNFLDASGLDDPAPSSCTQCAFPDGRYEVYLQYTTPGGTQIRVQQSVFMGTAPDPDVENPLTFTGTDNSCSASSPTE